MEGCWPNLEFLGLILIELGSFVGVSMAIILLMKSRIVLSLSRAWITGAYIEQTHRWELRLRLPLAWLAVFSCRGVWLVQVDVQEGC